MIHINKKNIPNMMKAIEKLENIGKEKENVPLVFAEIFKDEINANDEQRLYNGVKRMLKQYSEDSRAAAIINDFTRVISGGASLDQILQITMDEVENPSAEFELFFNNQDSMEVNE